MLTPIAKKALATETRAMCQRRMRQEIPHEAFVDWMGTMEQRYPGIGWEDAAIALDRQVRAKAVLTVRL